MLERYRSGHNEAVLKTVCSQGHMGSNPILSVFHEVRLPHGVKKNKKQNSSKLEKYPSWPKGHPWKGCRSLIAARGFESLLLRFDYEQMNALLSTDFELEVDTEKDKKIY